MTPTQLYCFGLITPFLLIAMTEFYVHYKARHHLVNMVWL